MDEQFFDAPGYFLDRYNVDELAQLRRDGRGEERFQLIASLETSTIDKIIHYARCSRQVIELTLISSQQSITGQVNEHFSDGISIQQTSRGGVTFVPRRRISTISYQGDFVLPIDFKVEPNSMWIYISNQFLDQYVTITSWAKRYEGILHAVGDEMITIKTKGRFDRAALRLRDIDRLEF